MPDAAEPMILPAAVLWDMDGTLIDSEPYWIATETELVEAHGGTWTHEDAVELIGSELTHSARVFQEHGVAMSITEIIDFLIERMTVEFRREVPWQPGARVLLQSLAEAGVPCAMVTMSYRSLAEPVAERAPSGALRVIVAGDEVTRGKPDPEPYLTAAARLGVDIRDCVAIEDSPGGLRSAMASGAKTIGVQCIVPIAPAPGLSRLPDLLSLTLADLAAIHAGQVIDRLGAAVETSEASYCNASL